MARYKLKIPIYGQTIRVYFDIESYHKDFPEYKKDGDNNCFAFVQCNDCGPCMVFIQAGNNTVAHECVHAAWDVLDYVGVKVSADNQEALAYLVGFITENGMNYRQHYDDKTEKREEQNAAQAQEQAGTGTTTVDKTDRVVKRPEAPYQSAPGD